MENCNFPFVTLSPKVVCTL